MTEAWRTPPIMGMPAPPPTASGGWLDNAAGAMGGLLGVPSGYGGLLSPEDRKAMLMQAMGTMGANLMANSGWSPNRVSLGQALGNSMLATQQQMGQQGNDMLQAMLLKTKLQKASETKKPADVQSYEYAKANGYKGTFEDWKRVGAAQPQSPAGIQEYEYFNKLTPDQQKQFLALQRSPVVPQVVTVNGVPTLVDRMTGATNPLSTQEAEVEAERLKQFESALAKARGTAQGEREGDVAKKGQNAGVVQGMLALADPLIDVATGSATGAAADKVAGWFGSALDGAKATAQLRVLQASLMTNMPRMEGPQSDADVLLYRQAAGEIGDPTVPRGMKKAALQTIRALQNRYAERAAELPSPGLNPNAPAPANRPPLSSFQK